MLKDHAKTIMLSQLQAKFQVEKNFKRLSSLRRSYPFRFKEKYHFHFYGPYSEELTLRVEELCNMGYLNEVREKRAGYYQYCYSITDAGRDFLTMQEVDMPALKDCLLDMNGQNARFLELVSTVMFFDTLEKDEVTEKIFTLKSKQKYTFEEIDQAYAYIEQLKEKAKLN